MRDDDGMAAAAGDRPRDRIADLDSGSSTHQQRDAVVQCHRDIAATRRTPEMPALVLPVRWTSNIPVSTIRRLMGVVVAGGADDIEAERNLEGR